MAENGAKVVRSPRTESGELAVVQAELERAQRTLVLLVAANGGEVVLLRRIDGYVRDDLEVKQQSVQAPNGEAAIRLVLAEVSS